jgi:hypothetical protein
MKTDVLSGGIFSGWRRDYQSRGLAATKRMPRGTDSPASSKTENQP